MAASIPSNGSSAKTSFELEPNPFEQSFASKDGNKQPPNIGSATSPQILTPGGRKLPPLVLSPNVPSSWGSSTQLPRTGLTPNESSMRTGLTPGGPAYPHSLSNMAITGLNTPGGSLGFTGFTPGLSTLLGTNTKEFDQQAQANANTATAAVPTTAPQTNGGVRDTTAPVNAVGSERPSSPKTAKRKSTSMKKEEETNGSNKRKKTAKPPKKKEEEASVEDEEDINTENMTEEEKRKNFLERNRVAASKCRQRKKQQIQKMETDLNFYLNEYNNLTATVDALKEQSLVLRTMISSSKPSSTPALLAQVDSILAYINQTNYMSRLRGGNPSNIVPTVQPINPALVQQNQQRAAAAAASVAAVSAGSMVGQVAPVPMVGGGMPLGPQMAQPQQQVVGNGKVLDAWAPTQ